MTHLKIFKPKQLFLYSVLAERVSRRLANAWNAKNKLDGQDSREVSRIKKSYFKLDTSSVDELSTKQKNEVLNKFKILKKLSKIQRYGYSRITDRTKKEDYLKSFLGYRRGNSGLFPVTQFRRPKNTLDTKTQSYKKTMYSVTENKKPMYTDLGNWIGVEIECLVPEFISPESYDLTCEDVGCEDEDCSGDHGASETEPSEDNFSEFKKYLESRGLKFVSLKRDGSIEIRGGYFAAELTVFFKMSDSSPLKNLCKALNDLGCTVNASCGLHVHLDMRDCLSKPNMMHTRAKRLGFALPILTQLVPQSRLSNTYCRLGVSRSSGDRYFAINKTSFKKYQTIETRLHSGTTDYTKIINWVSLLFKISRTRGLKESFDLVEMLKQVKCSDSEIEYFLKRAEKFQTAFQNEAA